MTTRTNQGTFSKTLTTALGLSALVLSMVSTTSQAQDNPLPLNYRNLTVKAVEVNNNQRRNIGGAKVTIEPRKPKDAARYVKFPQRRTTQQNSGQARFSKIPPSNEVGPYTVVVETKDCGTQKKNFRKNGGSDQRLQFTFNRCGKAAEVQKEFDRRAQGGYKLHVDLTYRGRPGGGLMVYVYGPDGKLIKRQRTSSGGGDTTFRAIQAGKGYRIEIKYGSRTLLKEKFNMPKENEALSYTID